MSSQSRYQQGENDGSTRRKDEKDYRGLVDDIPNLHRLLSVLSDTLPAAKQELDNVSHGIRMKSEISKVKTENDSLKSEVEKLKNDANLSQKNHRDEIVSLQQSIDSLKYQLSNLKRNQEENQHASKEDDRYKNFYLQAKEKIETYDRIQQQLQLAQEQLRKTKAELDDTKSRLSRQIGDKVTDNNPNIADLSDKNRPTKISERYQEMYDNQWTDAFEILDRTYRNEEKTVSTLFTLLLKCMSFCKDEADYQMKQLRTVLTMSQEKALPKNIQKQMKDCRKELAECSVHGLYETYMKGLRNANPNLANIAKLVPLFFKECFEVCWLMAVQDPPLEFGPDIHRGDTLNKDHYKPYTSRGDIVDYIVWPVLLLHKDGPVLFKGIAQCYGERQRAKSAPSKREDQSSIDFKYSASRSTVASRIKPQQAAVEVNTNYTPAFETSYGQINVRTQHSPYSVLGTDYKDDPIPTQTQIDSYFYWIDKRGVSFAKLVLGDTYEICHRYLSKK